MRRHPMANNEIDGLLREVPRGIKAACKLGKEDLLSCKVLRRNQKRERLSEAVCGERTIK